MLDIKKIIQDIWFGRTELWKVFWIYKVLVGGVINVIVEFFILEKARLLSVAALAIYTVFHVWVLKGLYACRFNCKNSKILASVVVGFVIINCLALALNVVYFFGPWSLSNLQTMNSVAQGIK